MSGRKFEKTLYMVVCKNERQAIDLFERTHAYWKAHFRGVDCLRVNPKILAVYNSCDAVIFVPERQMFHITSLQERIRAQLYNGEYVDKWLDWRVKRDD